jgi:hypothetical protein
MYGEMRNAYRVLKISEIVWLRMGTSRRLV